MSAPPIPPEALYLLRSFDYSALGNGDNVAGMNVLTSMCVTLADVAGPQAAIVTDKGESCPVGINLLTAGSLSAEQIAARVMEPLRVLQNNLSQNTMQAAVKSDSHLSKSTPHTLGPQKSPISPEHLASAKDSMLLDSLRPSEFGGDSFQSGAARLLRRNALSGGAEVLYRPGFYFEGNNPNLLSSQLVHCHMQHPLVHVPIADIGQMFRVERTCLGIMDGCSLSIKAPIHIKGFVVARTSVEVLKRLVESRDDASWPYRTLWLVEEPLGPFAPQIAKQVRLAGVQECYAAALESILSRRLGECPPTKVNADISLEQDRVVKHLVQLDQEIPGIAGALKNLFPTLVFGLHHIAISQPDPKGFPWSYKWAAPLAIHLADRMVHSFKSMLHADFLAERERIKASILQKLAERPHSARDLTRRHNKLPMPLCRQVLEELRAAGAVTGTGDLWKLVDRPALSNTQPPVIDVS
jgi:hypothetical protein